MLASREGCDGLRSCVVCGREPHGIGGGTGPK